MPSQKLIPTMRVFQIRTAYTLGLSMSTAISRDLYQQNGIPGILAGFHSSAWKPLECSLKEQRTTTVRVTLSWLIAWPGREIVAPFGMKVPSEKEKLFTTSLRAVTGEEKKSWVFRIRQLNFRHEMPHWQESRGHDAILWRSYRVFSFSRSISCSILPLPQSSKSPLATAQYTRSMLPGWIWHSSRACSIY